MHLSAQQADGRIRVAVHSVAERDVPDGTVYSEGEALLAQFDVAKALAKETFVAFAPTFAFAWWVAGWSFGKRRVAPALWVAALAGSGAATLAVATFGS